MYIIHLPKYSVEKEELGKVKSLINQESEKSG